MKYDGIIFDLDGTLWDSSKGVSESWNIVLSHYPEYGITVSAEQVRACMGLPMDEIARRLFPGLDSKTQDKLMDECCVNEVEYLGEHGGQLFPKVEETLRKLRETHKLFIVSNCQDGYIQCFLKGHHFEELFTDFESWGKTGLQKDENNRLVAERNGLNYPVYVGDTAMDAQSAKKAGMPFIFARYGFGDVKEWDGVVDSFDGLLKLEL